MIGRILGGPAFGGLQMPSVQSLDESCDQQYSFVLQFVDGVERNQKNLVACKDIRSAIDMSRYAQHHRQYATQ